MSKLIFLSVAACILFSCKESKPVQTPIDTSEMKEIALSADSTLYTPNWVQDVEVVPLETSERALVGKVEEVIVTEENIIIYDKQQKTVFLYSVGTENTKVPLAGADEALKSTGA